MLTFKEFDTPENRAELRKLMDLADNQDVPVDRTTVWHHWCATGGDIKKKPRFMHGFEIFFRQPPLQDMSVQGIDPDRILVVGTDAEIDRLGAGKTCPCSSILEILREQGLPESIKVTWSSHMSRFWSNLFNQEDFIGTPVSLPCLIITTGQIRNHDGHAASTHSVLSTLQGLAHHWSSRDWGDITVIAIPSPVYTTA